MRKSISTAVAAITFAGAVAAAAGSAEARPYNDYGRYYGHRGGGNTDTAIAAGVAGLAIGALLAGSSHRSQNYYSSGSYYGGRGGYYGAPRYGYGYGSPYAYGGRGYQTCESSRWVWDPYIGRRVLVRERFPC